MCVRVEYLTPLATHGVFYKSKSLMLAYRTMQAYAPAWQMHSSEDQCLILSSLWIRQSQYRLFSFVAPQPWNELPNVIRAGASLSTFKNLLKTHFFLRHLSPFSPWWTVLTFCEKQLEKPSDHFKRWQEMRDGSRLLHCTVWGEAVCIWVCRFQCVKE